MLSKKKRLIVAVLIQLCSYCGAAGAAVGFPDLDLTANRAASSASSSRVIDKAFLVFRHLHISERTEDLSKKIQLREREKENGKKEKEKGKHASMTVKMYPCTLCLVIEICFTLPEGGICRDSHPLLSYESGRLN